MTEDHEIKALRKDMEHLRDTVFGNGDKHGMNVVLQRIEDGLNRNTDALSKLVDRVGQQNHRIEKLEHENVRQDAKREERLVWEQKEAGKREKEATRIRWTFMAGLGLAGLLSGVVFGILDRL